MATIVDTLGREWDASLFRGYEMHDQGQAYTFNRYLVLGVLARTQGKVGLVYVDTPEEYDYITQIIKNCNRRMDLVEELEAIRPCATRELDSFKKLMLKPCATRELVEELKKRTGVEEIVVNPCEEYEIRLPEKTTRQSGPARIFVVTD